MSPSNSPASCRPSEEPKTVAIVGGGLVGCLQGCYLAKRGHHVNVYEKRPDVRAPPPTDEEVAKAIGGVSINLAMSERAITALKEVGLDTQVLQETIPMVGRMIHELDGRRWVYPYGTKDESIKSVGRQLLNQVLLSAVQDKFGVNVHFEYKLQSVDIDKGKLSFLNKDGEMVEESADLIIGCDGAYSVVRREMIKRTRMNFSQMYIPHGYVEIPIPPSSGANGGFAMEKNYLHIWPRGDFMLIGLPNQDKTFTGTLFMPFDMFDGLKTRADVLSFFKEKFPDSVDLIGEENLLSTFDKWKVQGLISVKCDPFHYKDRCVLMGDAAHAIVPFYGQGMNCGLEDCLVFKDAMDMHPDDLGAALKEYSRRRTTDAHAICDLAMYNYVEMRSKVNSKMFLVRRRVDRLLNWLMPATWVPLYTTVSFTRRPYQQCIDNKAWQDKIINRVIFGSMVGGAILTFAALHKVFQHRTPFSFSITFR